MRTILLFHHTSVIGGGSIGLVNTCRMLHEHYRLVALLPAGNGRLDAMLLEAGAERVLHYSGQCRLFCYYSGSCDLLTRTFWKRYFGCEATEKQILGIIRTEKPELLLANSIVQFPLGRLLINEPIRKIVYVRETFRENVVSRWIIKQINRYFDGVLAIAPYELRYASFDIPSQVVADVYTPPKPPYINKYDFDPNKFYVLYLGGEAEIKGFSTLLDSLRYVRSQKLCILFGGNVGNAAIGKELKKRRVQKTECAQLIGFINDVSQIMPFIDVLVFPSTKPHQPRPVMEAGYFGKPAILSDYPQTADFYPNNVGCLTYPPDDPKALAAVIDKLCGDPALCRHLGEENKRLSSKYHDFHTEKKKLLSFLARQLRK